MLFISHPYFYIDKTPMNWAPRRGPPSTQDPNMALGQIPWLSNPDEVSSWSSWGEGGFWGGVRVL